MMHVGFEGCAAVKINSAVFCDVTVFMGNVVDRCHLGLVVFPEHGGSDFSGRFDVATPTKWHNIPE
jgi:hypothetical protein